ncbi:MAG: GNAT family N-acetyltransferase [Alphaproteobacteria bacterium]
MIEIIRRMKYKDIPQVWELCKYLNYEGTEEDVKRRFSRINNLDNHALFVMADDSIDSKVYGFVHISIFYKLGRKRSIEVNSLAVDETLRGKGIGRKLMGRAEAWALEHDLPRIKVTSSDFRKDAHAFYEQLGYKLYKRSQFFEKIMDESNT